MAIRLLVADDHALFREGLKSLLKHEPEVEIVGEVDRMDRLLAVLEEDEIEADIVLLDLQMERRSLLEIPTIARKFPVIVVTASELVGDALTAIRLGASAIILKRFAVEMLMDAILCVARGSVWLPPHVKGELAARLRRMSASPLTEREEEVVRQVALGRRNVEVAQQLFISEDTVKTHLNNVFQKLGFQDRVQLIVYAIRAGIIDVHDRP